MNRTQVMALELVRLRLDPAHPDFSGSPEIRAALSDDKLRRYLETWVLPYVDAARSPETVDRNTREDIRRQFNNRAQSAAAAHRYREWEAAKRGGA